MNQSKIILYILLALLSVSAISCKSDKEKTQLIKKFIEKPQKIAHYIDKYPRITSLYKDYRLQNETQAKNTLSLLRKTIHKYFRDGYTIVCETKEIRFNDFEQTNANMHDIYIKGNNSDWMLKFTWVFDMLNWKLFDIKSVSKVPCAE